MTAAAHVHLLLEQLQGSQAAAPPGEGWLSPAERERLASLRAPVRRAQFIAGRWLMRQLLFASHGGSRPEDWPLTAAANGPLKVDTAHAEPLFLGLSHSGGYVACACGPGPVGLDIESTRRRRDFLALVAAVGTQGEQHRLRAMPEADRADYFYTLWTLKEAWIKSGGAGMTPGRMARLETRSVPAQDPQANAWLWEGPGFLLALVLPGDQAAPLWKGGQEMLKTRGRWNVQPLAGDS